MSIWSQVCPPSPTFTEESLPSLASRVYIVTGATSGIGFELAKILYSQSATVYLAARNLPKIMTSMQTVKESFPTSSGRLEPLEMDLSDLKSVQVAAKIFKEEENRLDGLVLNAGVMTPPEGSKTQQGYELQMGTNCLGGHLLLRSLEDLLERTVSRADKNSVRVVWLASTLQMGGLKDGISWDETKNEPKILKNQMENYMMSKAGNVFLAHETAARLGPQGIVSVCVNPGFLKTELQRYLPGPVSFLMGMVFKSPKFGSYGELFGLLSPDVTMEENGAFIAPGGHLGDTPDSVKAALKDAEHGGTGTSRRFVAWCESETKAYI